jgi:hypothetical protein
MTNAIRATAIIHFQNETSSKAKKLREWLDLRKSIGGREMYNRAELSDWKQSQLRYIEDLEAAAEKNRL